MNADDEESPPSQRRGRHERSQVLHPLGDRGRIIEHDYAAKLYAVLVCNCLKGFLPA